LTFKSNIKFFVSGN